MSELLPCPFCGGDNLNMFEHHMQGNRSKFGIVSAVGYRTVSRIQCRECETEAPLEIWNARPSPWVKVSERLPEDSGSYLVWTYEHPEFAYFNAESQGWSHPQIYLKVTHWMPIPPVPEEE